MAGQNGSCQNGRCHIGSAKMAVKMGTLGNLGSLGKIGNLGSLGNFSNCDNSKTSCSQIDYAAFFCVQLSCQTVLTISHTYHIYMQPNPIKNSRQNFC